MSLEERTSPKIDLEGPRRAKNAFNISVVTAILFSLVLLVMLIVNRSLATDLISFETLAAAAIISVISAWLSRRGKSDQGILLLIASLVILVASRVFIQQGLAIPIGVVHIILVSAIALYTLPAKWIGRTITLAFIVAVVTMIVDQYTVGVPRSTQPDIANAISLILGVAYLIVLARQFPNLPLRGKLIIGFLLLTTVPLIILGWQANTTTRAILASQARRTILQNASAATSDLQAFTSAQISAARNGARLPEIAAYMALFPSQRPGSDPEQLVLDSLDGISKNDPIYIKSYSVIDKKGIDLVDTNRSRVGANFAGQEFFKFVTENQNPYVSGLILSTEAEDRNLYIAAPIISRSNQQVLGVFLITFNANVIQALFDQRNRDLRSTGADFAIPVDNINSFSFSQSNSLALPNATEYTYLIDSTNFFVLGHSDRVDVLYKTYLGKDDPRINQLVQDGFIQQGDLESLALGEPEIVANLSGMEASASFRAPSWEFNNELAEAAAVRVPNTTWIMVTAQPVSTITALTQSQTRATLLTSVIIISLVALLAIVVSNLFTAPLIQLTRVAENISAGDFTQKANVGTKDEIGVLAYTFNKMSTQIQDSVAGLEKRVEQRTSELALASQVSENRARQLQSIAEIARYISTEKDLTRLLPLVTRSVSERFGFYHVGIFLLDETGKFAVLRASNSAGGQDMLRRQHRLEVGQTGIVGNVTSTGTPRIALETGSDAVYFNNPNLPDTRSELALPLKARGSIIGALDVQSTKPHAFGDTDVSILGLLADQVAIAIDNARLIEETQGLLAESQSIFNEYIAESWQKKTGSAIMGYHQTLTGGKIITSQTPPNGDGANSSGDKSFEVPIRVRDQVIGMLNIKSVSNDRVWNSDDINVVQAVAERLGLALDNARLFEETSTRASRERLVTEITTRIRGTNNPQEMIRTAVEELQRALGATRVEIVPRKPVPPLDH